MTSLERLKSEAAVAAKAKDDLRLQTLRLASSALHYKEIEKRGPLTEVEVSGVLLSLCKQRRESIEQFEKGGRMDLVSKERRELEILQEFLPKQFTREEIVAKAKGTIASLGASSAKDRGKVMKVLMGELKGQAEGSIISSIVSELLP